MAASRLLSSSLRSSLTRSASIFRSPNLSFCTTPPMSMSTAAGPWMMLPLAFESGGSNMVYNFYSLPENKVVSFIKNTSFPPLSLNSGRTTDIVGSSHGWLAHFNRTNYDLFLSNPITDRHVKLPPIRGLPIPQCSLDYGYEGISKVIISGDDPESEDCRAMIIFNATDSLAFCCPILSTEWTPIGQLRNLPPYGSDSRTYEDVVFYKKLFFCLTEMDVNDLECWDVGDLHSPKLHWSNHNDLLGEENYLSWYRQVDKSLFEGTGSFCRPLRYLVAAPDHQLFLVTRHMVEHMASDGSSEEEERDNRYPHKTIAFDVHKIDPDEDGGRGKLTHVEGLDGLAMFVGLNHSFAVSASDHQLKPNSIYFTDCAPSLRYRTYRGHDVGIFNYENRTIAPCYCYPWEFQRFMSKIIEPAGPIWFTPSSSTSLA